MAWQEVLTAKTENRHEIILSGNEISNRINKSGLDSTIFTLINLNYLNIHETSLNNVPEAIENLTNLQTLVLHSNKLQEITSKISRLSKLKVLDLSRNCLKTLPDNISDLSQLVTLNVSSNQLESFPKLASNSKLSVIDVVNNKLTTFPDVCYLELTNLSEIRCSGNEIDEIPNTIGTLLSLKIFLLNSNKVKIIPGELSDCNKLKDLNLKDNPISDRRLLKLVSQGHTKQIVDYIKQNCQRVSVTDSKPKKGKKSAQNKQDNDNGVTECLHKITVRHFTNDSVKVIVKEDVKQVRAHLITCLVLNFQFTEATFKKFIQIQTKLHDTICDKRNAATIATHDATKLLVGDLTYTAVAPNSLFIKPLNLQQDMTGAQLFKKLQVEADNLRKEKKRNVYSGIHKYLYLLEGKPLYPCLVNSDGEVISFPPITNSDVTKMTVATTSLLIEVTSATSQGVCKKIADILIKEMLSLFGNLTIQQVKNVDDEGNLKSVYPARTDLVYDDMNGILVERE